MKSIPDVIAELSRAAAEVPTLSEGEKLRLLGRAYITIHEGWEALGQSDYLQESAEAVDLIQAGRVPLHLYDDEMQAILLEAVKVIRQIEAALEARDAARPEHALADR
ncbi:hypothetical protein [Shinella zoogloeoides]|uniref:hypothetical protein n=1 Tax=Shinella zoogloeoides TaxID=352475 RepID=UPI00299E0A29|nr:hypothetical protein [Shinella zoogloeoides]WPE23893.1 hypothetical protein ShzoTeo12_51130 [Shinella zoogloeoides]